MPAPQEIARRIGRRINVSHKQKMQIPNLPGEVKFAQHIAHQVNLARAYHETWRTMTGPAMIPTYADLLNDHFRLAKIIQVSLTSSFIITLCALFDNGKNAISLQRLAKFVHARDGTLPALWATRFRAVRKRMLRLFELRSNAFAHKLDSKFVKDVFKEAGFTYNDLSEIMDNTWSLTDELLRLYNGYRLTYDMDTSEDLKRVFPKLNPAARWG